MNRGPIRRAGKYQDNQRASAVQPACLPIRVVPCRKERRAGDRVKRQWTCGGCSAPSALHIAAEENNPLDKGGARTIIPPPLTGRLAAERNHGEGNESCRRCLHVGLRRPDQGCFADLYKLFDKWIVGKAARACAPLPAGVRRGWGGRAGLAFAPVPRVLFETQTLSLWRTQSDLP